MYSALLKIEDIKEDETLIVYNHTKNGVHKYLCKRCGCTDIEINDDVCPKCGCKII